MAPGLRPNKSMLKLKLCPQSSREDMWTANDSILNFVLPVSSPQDTSSVHELTRRSPFWRELHHSTTVQCAFKEQGAAERKRLSSQPVVMEQLDKQKDK